VTDFLDEKRKEIADRLKELKPLVDEYHRLEAAAGGSAISTARSAISKRGPGRPRGAASKAAPKTKRKAGGTTKRRAGRRKGSGTRAAEALSLVQGQPGITIPELAAKMGIKQNYLYRVLPGLEQEKKVAKKGRGWYPKA
jgi:hypothetical protein